MEERVRTVDRRRLLAAAAGGAASLALNTSAVGAADPGDIIDTHTHFYDPSRPQGVPWPPKEDRLLYRSVLPAEYQALAAPLGVIGTVVVEASNRVEDNQWVLDLAERNPIIVGLVGHLDPGTDDYLQHLRRFSANKLFRGIRIGGGVLKSRLGEARFLADLQALADRDLELDVNGGPDMLPHIARLAAAVPKLRIVINHVANLRIDGQPPPISWRDGMRRAGEHPRVYCKVSALVEGAASGEEKAPTDPTFYRPVLDTVWEAFGEDRLVYGSNWPVSARAAPYPVVQRIVSEYFQGKGQRASEKYFRRNAQAAYKWVRRNRS